MADEKQQAKKIKEEFKDKAGKETREPKAERDTSDNPVKETIRDEAKRPGGKR
jgi:hypothetical protein